jgi:hypothetical protein
MLQPCANSRLTVHEAKEGGGTRANLRIRKLSFPKAGNGKEDETVLVWGGFIDSADSQRYREGR